jgi:hypothetical protein
LTISRVFRMEVQVLSTATNLVTLKVEKVP